MDELMQVVEASHESGGKSGKKATGVGLAQQGDLADEASCRMGALPGGSRRELTSGVISRARDHGCQCASMYAGRQTVELGVEAHDLGHAVLVHVCQRDAVGEAHRLLAELLEPLPGALELLRTSEELLYPW
jgi:hypothetical protein